MDRLVFLDTETTGLGPLCEVWELAAIVRDLHAEQPEDIEYLWQFRPMLDHAEPTGLRISRYYERSVLHNAPPGTAARIIHPDGSGIDEAGDTVVVQDACQAVIEVAKLLDRAVVVGAVPWFDERKLERLLGQHGQVPTHHYHLVDVETLAAGKAGIRPPWEFPFLLSWFGLKQDPDDRHTALGDTRATRDLYDAVYADANANRDRGDEEEGPQ